MVFYPDKALGTVKVRKNRADPASGPSVTIPATATGIFEDTTNTVTVAAADELDYQIISANGVLTVPIISVIFDATTNCVTQNITQGVDNLTTASLTNYHPIAGNRSGSNATENNVEQSMRIAGNAKNSSMYVSATQGQLTQY